MNTSPDETKLALWLDDELEGEELAAFEAWVADQPQHLAAREEVRRWRQMIAATVPASEEPPYPEFFNHRIARAIRENTPPASAAPARPAWSWRAWFMPVAACAGMAIAFWLGTTRSQPGVPEIDVAGAPKAIPVEPILYTPEKGVQAEWFTSTGASATVIVLSGVEAIPDATDFSETVFLRHGRDIDSTAGIHTSPDATGP